MSLKNFRKQTLQPEHKRALEALFATFTVDTERCRLCGQSNGWTYAGVFHPSGNPCYGGICYDCQTECTHVTTVTGYIIKRNGSMQVRVRCVRCNREPYQSAPRRGTEYADVLLADMRDSSVCERCGSLDGVEYHHYAPRNVFPDADKWATGYLCVTCHHEWHRAMNGYTWNAKRRVMA